MKFRDYLFAATFMFGFLAFFAAGPFIVIFLKPYLDNYLDFADRKTTEWGWKEPNK